MLTAKLILERLDKEGRLLERREQRSRSFTAHFIELLYVAHAEIASGAPYTMDDIGGTPRTVDNATVARPKANLLIGAPPGLSRVICYPGGVTLTSAEAEACSIEGEKIGIQVGTGSSAVLPTDDSLTTRIAHGRTAGLLEYGGCELIGIAFADPNGEFTIRRYFTNASGGPITVEEVGINSIGTDSNDNEAWAFLIAHDLTGGIPVADGEILRVTYVPQIAV